MKVQIKGYRLKFKKANAAVALRWLSGLVHTLAAVNKNAEACLLTDSDSPLEVWIPELIEARNADLESTRYATIYPSDLAELKAARRKVAAVVQLERMP